MNAPSLRPTTLSSARGSRRACASASARRTSSTRRGEAPGRIQLGRRDFPFPVRPEERLTLSPSKGKTRLEGPALMCFETGLRYAQSLLSTSGVLISISPLFRPDVVTQKHRARKLAVRRALARLRFLLGGGGLHV